MKEAAAPLWREVLNWGCVIYFLGLPAIALFLGFTHFELFPPGSGAHEFFRNFHLSVSALVATIAGLNSFDRAKANGGKPTAGPVNEHRQG